MTTLAIIVGSWVITACFCAWFAGTILAWVAEQDTNPDQ